MPLPRKTAYAPIALLAALSACGSGETAPPAAPETRAAAAEPASAATPSAAAMTGPAMSKDELAKAVCFFTPDEVTKTLGFSVGAGTADTKMLDGYGMASCTYSGSDNELRISAFWIDPAQVGPARSGMTRMSGGGQTEVIAGDPDSAYLHDQQDNGTSLHYLRRNVRIQLHATSGRTPFATMKPKLLALRRVP